jgi:hypothetical protein
VGKTSLLKRLARRLGGMNWRCAYVDLATLMDLPKPKWYTELGKSLSETLTPGQVPALANQVDLRDYLVNQALPWPKGQPCIALFLDEVEGAGKVRASDGNPFSDTFFMVLRNLYIQRDDYEGTIVVAMAGAVNPDELVRDPDISPFNVGQEVGLDDFTPTETQSLTSNLGALKVEVDGAVHQAIYNWSSGHPYLTQRICAELERSIEDDSITALTSDHVDRAVEQIINPTNPLQQDKNLRHVTKMLDRLSPKANNLWARLQAGESVSRREVSFLELYLTGAVKAQAERLVIRNRIYASKFGDVDEGHSETAYEEYAEQMLVAFYEAHQDPKYPGARAHGLPGLLLATKAGIVSEDEWKAETYSSSHTRWEVVAALRDLMNQGYIKRTEDDVVEHGHPDEWNFRLTPEGRDYVRDLQSLGEEAHSKSPKSSSGRSIRVFLSSTWKDLQAEREAVEEALHRMQDTVFAGMEYFGSRPETSREASLAEVDRSNIYIGIFAHRYGSGITEAEYRRAREREIPCLIYLKDDTVPVVPKHVERGPEKAARLEDLKQELKEQHTASFFKGPDHLATQVVTDLHNLLATELSVVEKVLPEPGPKYQITMTNAQGVAIGDQAKVVQRLGSPSLAQDSDLDALRFQHLANNLRQDLALLKEYEDALRYEDDPRRQTRYRREIEKLRKSAARYQREYEALQAQEVGEPSEAMRDVISQLQQMDAKLDGLTAGQTAIRDDLSGLRQTILTHFETSEQSIIKATLDRLERAQLETVQTILHAIDAKTLSEHELRNTLTVFRDTLKEIRRREAILADRDLTDKLGSVSEAIEAPRLDAKNKLKVTVPIIPLLLSYEGEIELGCGMNLEAAWQRLITKVRGEQ